MGLYDYLPLPPEKRHSKRITHPYIIRFKPLKSANWDSVTLIDISRTGACFHTRYQYQANEEIEFKIINPETGVEGYFVCSVVRSQKSKKMKILFKTAVRMIDADEPSFAIIDDIVRINGERAED
ncbi:MAG: PilZ domain-containing protein [Candidatus Omnitrophica bacterium]|nr:PilZ domain-containing protein [Candidatus Omnitrophota bacterium]